MMEHLKQCVLPFFSSFTVNWKNSFKYPAYIVGFIAESHFLNFISNQYDLRIQSVRMELRNDAKIKFYTHVHTFYIHISYIQLSSRKIS